MEKQAGVTWSVHVTLGERGHCHFFEKTCASQAEAKAFAAEQYAREGVDTEYVDCCVTAD